MNAKANTNVSYDVMTRYVRLYKAHREEAQKHISYGKYVLTPNMTNIRNRMKQLVHENPELITLWKLPGKSNHFLTTGPSIHAITNDEIYNDTYGPPNNY